MKTAYRLRFVPVIFMSVILAGVLVLKYIFNVSVGRVLNYSILFFFVAFIFMRAMQDLKKQEEKHTKPLEENPEEIYAKVLVNKKKKLTGNDIPIAIVRLLFAVLLIPMGIMLVFNGVIVFGMVICAGGLVVTLLSVVWLSEHMRRLK